MSGHAADGLSDSDHGPKGKYEPVIQVCKNVKSFCHPFYLSVYHFLCFSLCPFFFLSDNPSLLQSQLFSTHSFPPSQREIRQSEALLTGPVKYLSWCEERSKKNVFYMCFCGSACAHSDSLSLYFCFYTLLYSCLRHL